MVTKITAIMVTKIICIDNKGKVLIVKLGIILNLAFNAKRIVESNKISLIVTCLEIWL